MKYDFFKLENRNWTYTVLFEICLACQWSAVELHCAYLPTQSILFACTTIIFQHAEAAAQAMDDAVKNTRVRDVLGDTLTLSYNWRGSINNKMVDLVLPVSGKKGSVCHAKLQTALFVVSIWTNTLGTWRRTRIAAVVFVLCQGFLHVKAVFEKQSPESAIPSWLWILFLAELPNNEVIDLHEKERKQKADWRIHMIKLVWFYVWNYKKWIHLLSKTLSFLVEKRSVVIFPVILLVRKRLI